MTSDDLRVLSDIEAQDYKAGRGTWLVANVEQQFGWPQGPKLVKFKENRLLFLPQGQTTYPAVAVRTDEVVGDPKEVISEFLSALSWHENSSILVKHWSGGSHPIQMGRDNFLFPVAMGFRLDFLEIPRDRNGRLALAFYRDALSLNHVAYSFLSFYKIINLRFPVSADQKKWISANLGSIESREAVGRIAELGEADIGEYLYVSGRCAVAHAGMEPVVDPDSSSDFDRLTADLPLIRSLAEKIIEKEYGLKSSRTIRHEHKYQTHKIRELFGQQAVEKILAGEHEGFSIAVPDSVSFRLHNREQFPSLERMTCFTVRIHQATVFLEFISISNYGKFRVGFDFKRDLMVFDPQLDYGIDDDGTATAASNAADWANFMEKYYLNGVLEIWDSEEDVRIAWADAFIPVNIDLDATARNFSELREEYRNLERRRNNEAGSSSG